MKNEYDKVAEDFLHKTNTEFKSGFICKGYYWPSDKEKRNIYWFSLVRNDGRYYHSTFGDSMQKTKESLNRIRPLNLRAYDVLAGLFKEEVGSLSDFVDNFCDEFTKETEGMYFSCKKEYESLAKLFNEEEMNLLREIQ